MNQTNTLIEVCDLILEAGQNELLFQEETNKVVKLALSDYNMINYDEMITYLLQHELRLFEDECDQDGHIINSVEQVIKTLDNVEIKDNYIVLTYNDAMIDLIG